MSGEITDLHLVPIKHDPARLDRFAEVYQRHLIDQITAHPERYRYGVADVPRLMPRIREAWLTASFGKDTDAYKATCRELKIRHTYKDIVRYLTGQ